MKMSATTAMIEMQTIWVALTIDDVGGGDVDLAGADEGGHVYVDAMV